MGCKRTLKRRLSGEHGITDAQHRRSEGTGASDQVSAPSRMRRPPQPMPVPARPRHFPPRSLPPVRSLYSLPPHFRAPRSRLFLDPQMFSPGLCARSGPFPAPALPPAGVRKSAALFGARDFDLGAALVTLTLAAPFGKSLRPKLNKFLIFTLRQHKVASYINNNYLLGRRTCSQRQAIETNLVLEG